MRLLEAMRNAVRDLIKDEDRCVNENALAAAVQRGSARLSECRPRVLAVDWTGDGLKKVFDLPSSFESGFSSILRVLYPFDPAGGVLAGVLSAAGLTLIDAGGGVYRLHVGFAPAAGKTVRATFTARHSVDETVSTLSAVSDEDALLYWAAAECLQMMAAQAVAVGDSLLGADTVSYQTRSGQYKALAEHYADLSGLRDAPAFVYARVPLRTAQGETYLSH